MVGTFRESRSFKLQQISDTKSKITCTGIGTCNVLVCTNSRITVRPSLLSPYIVDIKMTENLRINKRV